MIIPIIPKGSFGGSDYIGSHDKDLLWTLNVVEQKLRSKKHEQSAAPKSVSTWPPQWFNLAPKTAHIIFDSKQEGQRLYYGSYHLNVVKIYFFFNMKLDNV